ncbi:DEAD/DEAH box helicase family protein [Alphaproteobacteria bacterium]|nr:DEAD/DEAH box helicase family protein [Alphaproteobacteria bacterium]
MNEAETRAELIDPKIAAAGWGKNGSVVRREYNITKGEIKAGGARVGLLKADYILIYKNRKLAVIEAKSDELETAEGVAQAKDYAIKLKLQTAYATNGKSIYEINFKKNYDGEIVSDSEGEVENFPTPEELWNKTFKEKNDINDSFNAVQYETFKGDREPRYYQEIAINNALNGIANNQKRILLTLATGTGKTVIAFHIAWKLFQARWNLSNPGNRIPRILFLADRNILANQAYLSFSAFDENALVRISPKQIKKVGSVPTNGSIFFTIFQTFMSGPKGSAYFGEYPKDFFDLIIVDECHRGGANDESTWREILEYFDSAVQIGLTATPKREINADTYSYFGEPAYTYSLQEGIKDGYLTPFKVNRIQTTMDEYVYTKDDEVIQGEIEEGKIYKEDDFNRIIEITAREKKRIELMAKSINTSEKTLVFCANQAHAALVRDLINQVTPDVPADYCVRVTANDGALGETYLKQFQDNEKTIPTILTTSQKLSTGVDALNVRNIVLLRPVNTMIEFKQIIGRGTRLFEGKHFFTILDFVNAYHMFADPEWDGEPIEQVDTSSNDGDSDSKNDNEKDNGDTKQTDNEDDNEDKPKREKIKIKLNDNKIREIKSMSTVLYYVDGEPVTGVEFLKDLFATINLPEFFNNEEELRNIWSSPLTRKELLDKLDNSGFSRSTLKIFQQFIEAENSDLFDLLQFVAFAKKPISRISRVESNKNTIHSDLNTNQKEFIDFVLGKYIEGGDEELDIARLSDLITLKYDSIHDGMEVLGEVEDVKNTFIDFQKHLYFDNENRTNL